MYPITNAVKALFDDEQRQVLRITGMDKNGVAISITDANVVMGGFNIDRFSCNGEKLEVGTAVAAEMTLRLNNVNGEYNDIVFEGAELFVEIGIADWTQDDPTINWIPCGYFTPDEQPRSLSKITIKALDRMILFDDIVNTTLITLPDTVAGLVGQVCTICDVTLADDISGLTNADVSIAELPEAYGNMTYRNIIQWCAGLMATNAWVDWNGELNFSWYDNATDYELTTENRFSSDYYEDDLTVTGVKYTNASGETIISGTDDYAIDLTGNALAGSLLATVLPAIHTALNGFTYRPFTASVINAPYLWPMDTVDFTDKDGNTYASVLTNVAYGLNGATALESNGMTYAINAKAQPTGVTKQQAQLINEISQGNIDDFSDTLTQEDIFNRLTNNGQEQGIYLMNGKVYIDASFIYGGMFVAGGLNNENGVILVKDANGNTIVTLNNNGAQISDGTIINYNSDGTERVILDDGYLKFQKYGQDAGSGQYMWLNRVALTLGSSQDSLNASRNKLYIHGQLGIKLESRVMGGSLLPYWSTIEQDASGNIVLHSQPNGGNPVVVTMNANGFNVKCGLSSFTFDSFGNLSGATWEGSSIGVAYGGTGAISDIGARHNLSAATYIILGSSNTWASIYSKLSVLNNQETAAVFIADASTLTDDKVANVVAGIVTAANKTNGVYEFMCKGINAAYIYTWRINGLTSARATPTVATVYRFTGTAL